MPPYRADLGGMFGSGIQNRPGGTIDIGGAIAAIGNQASSLLQAAYVRKLNERMLAQQQADRQARQAADAEARRLRDEESRFTRAQRLLEMEGRIREMGYVPDAERAPTPDVRVPMGTMGAVPVGGMVDAVRGAGPTRTLPDGRVFRLDPTRTPEAQEVRKADAAARKEEVANTRRLRERDEAEEAVIRRERLREARGRSTRATDDVENTVRSVVARAAMEGIPVEGATPDFITGKVPMRKATEQELATIAARVRRVLTGEVKPGTPSVPFAERVQQLKAAGLSKDEARRRMAAEGYDVGTP